MAKQKSAPAASAKTGTSTINRKRRNALERKSLPKYLKVIFRTENKSTFKAILAAWKDGRKKVKEAYSPT
jgi:hypothetical protein